MVDSIGDGRAGETEYERERGEGVVGKGVADVLVASDAVHPVSCIHGQPGGSANSTRFPSRLTHRTGCCC